jgi:hypothetical protein
MEKFPTSAPERIILCMQDRKEYDLYESILPLYFPRSKEEEERVTLLLPEDIGGHQSHLGSFDRE